MAENDDVQWVESISDGMSLTSNVKNVHMHGFVGVSYIVIASNPIDIATTSNYVFLASNYVAFASNSTKVEM
jgi:hypothetical protein